MSKVSATAYGSAIRAVVECCERDNSGSLNLKGLVVDWSSAQISGIKFAFGEEKAEELLRGCQVNEIHILMHSHHQLFPVSSKSFTGYRPNRGKCFK